MEPNPHYRRAPGAEPFGTNPCSASCLGFPEFCAMCTVTHPAFACSGQPFPPLPPDGAVPMDTSMGAFLPPRRLLLAPPEPAANLAVSPAEAAPARARRVRLTARKKLSAPVQVPAPSPGAQAPVLRPLPLSPLPWEQTARECLLSQAAQTMLRDKVNAQTQTPPIPPSTPHQQQLKGGRTNNS